MNELLSVPQPIPYQGSKRIIAPEILSWFPEKIERFVEPFAGSAALSIALAVRQRASKYWFNDAHQPLMDLWKAIIETPEELADSYDTLWHEQLGNERKYYNQIRERFNRSHEPADFLYLLARCVKAAIRYNSNGEFNNTPDNRRKGARPETMKSRIMQTSHLFSNRVKLTSWDYKSVLKKCNTNDLVYMDPPYQGVCKNRDARYCPAFVHDEFCEEIEKLLARNIRFVISYDGRTGNKVYGQPLPKHFHLVHIEIAAGRSTQATLLGRNEETVESLYLSPGLQTNNNKRSPRKQIQPLFWS